MNCTLLILLVGVLSFVGGCACTYVWAKKGKIVINNTGG